MSLAWGSLVLLIVLLPGVLFFVGTYFPDKFTREAEDRSPLGQLAGALLVAFVIHGLAYGVLTGLCGSWLPCIALDVLLDAINVDPRVAGASRRLSHSLAQYRWWIFAYVIGSCAAGVGLGAIYGAAVSSRRVRGLSRHSWVYDLSVDGLTYAYVMTHIKQDDRILMYKGFLRGFGLQKDGRFSYIVLTEVTRFYMRLGAEASETVGAGAQRVIGGSTDAEVPVPAAASKPHKRLHSLFVIEGEDIANAVFDVLETPAEALSREQLMQMIKEEARSLGLDLSDDELADIISRAT